MIYLMERKPDRTLYAKYNKPDKWYGYEKKHLDELEKRRKLKDGEYYPVSTVFIGESNTTIKLVGINVELNSIFFDIYEKRNGTYVEYDIFEDPKLNPFKITSDDPENF